MFGLLLLVLAQPWVPTGGVAVTRQGPGMTDGGTPWQVEISDGHNGMRSSVSVFGDLVIAQSVRLVGPSFTGTTLDSNFWNTTNTTASGDAGVTLANSVATLSNGTTFDGGVYLNSVKTARFLFAHPNKFRAAIRLTELTSANNTRWWGVRDSTNGLGFKYAGGVFSVFYTNNGVTTTVSSGSFNGAFGRTKALDTNIHAYEIEYFTMGTWWYVDGVLLHQTLPTTSPSSGGLTLPIQVASENAIGATTAHPLEVWNASVLRLGSSYSKPASARVSTNTTAVLKRGAGTLHRVTIGKPGSVNNVVTIYDNTAASGTVLAVISGTETTAASGTYTYDIDFYTGLTAVSATGTAPDMTVVYE